MSVDFWCVASVANSVFSAKMSKKAKNSLTIHSIPDDLLEFILALACFEPEVDDIYEKRPFLDSTEPNLAYEPSSAGS